MIVHAGCRGVANGDTRWREGAGIRYIHAQASRPGRD